MKLNLESLRVAITGGTRGIGRATAELFAREGAVVSVIARGPEGLDTTVGELTALGASAYGVRGDVSSAAGAREAGLDASARMGGLDVLVNNAAGSLGTGGLGSTSQAQWADVVDLNLNAAVWSSRAALEPLAASAAGGVIVHVSSICGLGYCSSAPYTVAKGALSALTKSMAIDLAKDRIRVVAVAPGSILFPGGSWDKRHTTQPDRVRRMLDEELPFGRFGTPEEVANAIVFLSSARASWITGTTLVVDGGQSRAVL